MLNLLDLSGRRILVTGASSGIGRQTAITLSELGARLILTGRDAGRLEATKQRLAGEAHVVEPFDLSQGDAILGWLKKVTDAAGPLRGLVHCAAIQSLVPLRVMTAAAMESMYRANAVSAALLVRAFQQRDCFSPPASIVLVASTAAFLGVPANAAYGATKAAIMSMCRSFALEVVDRGIRVNCVAPGLVETEMVAAWRENMTQEMFQAVVDKHPLGIGQPQDIAGAIAFLLADTGRWMTGSTMVVDGGLSVP